MSPPILESMRLLEADHRPDSWPAVRMRDISALIAEIDRLNARLGTPFGYGIIFGDERQHRCLVLDHAKAEAKAGELHGVRLALYADPAEMDAAAASATPTLPQETREKPP